MSYIWFYNNDFALNYWQVTITEEDQYETISDTGMLMNYDNTIMEILQKNHNKRCGGTDELW